MGFVNYRSFGIQSSSMVESRRVGINRGSHFRSISNSRMFWTYILENPAGRFYIGHTEKLEARLENHNRTDRIAGKFTRKNGPWKLVWSEAHPTRSSAMQPERKIKGMKSARWIRECLLDKQGHEPPGWASSNPTKTCEKRLTPGDGVCKLPLLWNPK